MREVSKGGRRSPFGSGSSNRGEQHPCWHRVSKGKQRCPWQGYPKGTAFPLVHDFPAGKSSVLYLCFRLTPGRGWLRHLRLGQMGRGQTLFGGSRTGGFCADTDEIRICTEGKIHLAGKGSKGISKPTFRRSDSAFVSLRPPWISHGFCRHYIGSYTGHCKRRRWTGCPGTPSGSACTGAGAGHRPPA